VLVDAEYHPAWSDLTDGLLDSLPPQIWLGCPRDTAPGAITLDRPVQASSLLNAVINRLTPNASEAVRRADAGATLIGDGQRVLVADDNEVNRIVASEMLKRLGFVAVLACDGTEVIDRLRVDPIDIVLIDCEMPLLGGIEATRELRRLHTSGELAVPPGRPLRIIACTAQAMEGDRERCLSVGMDDYLSKPIRREELMAALRGSVNSADPLDYAELLDRCGGDEAVVAEVLNVFAGRCRGDVKSLGEAIHRRSPEIAPIAHYLKGAAATLGASGLSAIAGQIETLASAGLAERFDVFEDSLAKLDAEMDRCVAWIEEQLTRLG
jgi:CheY-like chemotaxis protein